MKYYKYFLLIIIGFACTVQAQTLVSPNSNYLSYSGRIGFEKNGQASFYWPGSWISIKFKGTSAKVTLSDKSPENYFYIIIDQRTPVKLHVDTGKKEYLLADHLAAGIHYIQLYKLTNATPATIFYGFKLGDNAVIMKPDPKPKRKIEFYGNSITVGHGVEVRKDSTDSQDSKYFNNYLSYAAITARHFNAQYFCIARSGIGLTISWFPEIMPETYDRLNPYDSSSKWDFSRYIPDIVVINLLQNDYWLTKMPKHEQFKARFGTVEPDSVFMIQAYRNFLNSIRTKYAEAKIICTLGSMNATEKGSPYPGYITQAIVGMNDKNIYHFFYPFKNTPGHPKIKEQQDMADRLISFIDKNIKW